MEYTINSLSQLAGVTTRTLRYYDKIGLLKPKRTNSSGYRIYGAQQVDTLQQILFYRELDVPLAQIQQAIASSSFERLKTLEKHMSSLLLRQKQITSLIANLEKTIQATKGEANMKDKEKFEGFKQKLVADNEKEYGKEIRQSYGENIVNASNKKILDMTQTQHNEIQSLSNELNESLKAAFLQGDPASAAAQKVCELHKKWLCFYWSSYSKEAHMGVVQMYVDDPRFTTYYDKIAEGSAEFLRDAVMIYCK